MISIKPYGFVSGSGTALGPILFTDGTAAAPSLTFASETGLGAYRVASGIGGLAASGATPLEWSSGYVYPGADGAISLGSSTNRWLQLFAVSVALGSNNVLLSADAANTLALKNGTNAQTFRLYYSTTGPAYAALVATGDGLLALQTHSGAGGNLAVATINASAEFDLNGRLLASNTAPTIASGFGTGASIAHSNGTAAFTVNVGTTSSSAGVITMPAAPNGWACQCTDISSNSTSVFLTKQTATTTTSITIGNFTDIAGAAAWPDNAIISCIAFPY